MLFNSFEFLLFFPLVVFILFTLPQKMRWVFLLICSYAFYGSWNPKYLLLILTSTLITFYSSKFISKANKNNELTEKQKTNTKKTWLILSLVLNLIILYFFKYFNFTINTVNELANTNYDTLTWIILPVGISFYTFQALSYTLDVYYNKIETEPNLGKYALFVSFFPQLVAGPIEKANHLLPQLHEQKKFNYEKAREGLLIMAIGFFKKLVIADRLAIFVNKVYESPDQASGISILLAIIFFAFQLYLDFSAYSEIAIGAAKVMGYDLSINFKRPYLAKTFGDFWNRWHISLSSWFKEYLYFPLGGNKKGKQKMMINMMIVFLISGLWHGASWNFVIWGAINGIFLTVFDSLFQKSKDSAFGKYINPVFVTSCWMLSLVFFRAQTFTEATSVLSKIGLSNLESITEFGLNASELKFTFFIIISLIVMEIISEKVSIQELILKAKMPIRWSIYLIIVLSTLLFGAYGSELNDSSFIYFQF